MRIHEDAQQNGEPAAFEVDHTWLSHRGLRRIVESLPGARIVPVRSTEGRPEEIHCAFEYDGIYFIVWEPFGDSSRYRVVASPARAVPQLAAVRAAFERTTWWQGLVGGAS